MLFSYFEHKTLSVDFLKPLRVHQDRKLIEKLNE